MTPERPLCKTSYGVSVRFVQIERRSWPGDSRRAAEWRGGGPNAKIRGGGANSRGAWSRSVVKQASGPLSEGCLPRVLYNGRIVLDRRGGVTHSPTAIGHRRRKLSAL